MVKVLFNKMQKFEIKHTVTKNEIDELNHVNNIVYLQWVQDVAAQHWKSLIKQNPLDKKYIWVVVRHEIDYLHSAILNDIVTLQTWVRESSGAKSIRHVAILKEGKVLAKAQTTWCLLDAETMKPTRITENVLNTLLPKK